MSDSPLSPGDIVYYIYDDPTIFCPKLVIIMEMMGHLCKVYDAETSHVLMAFRTELMHVSET